MVEQSGLPGGMPCEDCEQGISTCCLTPVKPDRYLGPPMPDRVGLSEVTKEYVGPSKVHLRVSLSDGSYPSSACGWLNSLGQWWSGDPAEVTCFDCMGGGPRA